MFSWVPEAVSVLEALRRVGISVSYVCDFTQPVKQDMPVGDGVIVKPYRELLCTPEKYYFILYGRGCDEPVHTGRPFFWVTEKAKLLQYHGVDEFGVVVEGFTKDFMGKSALQEAFFSSINEIFGEIPLLNQWDAVVNCRRSALENASYWDVLYIWIYRLYKRQRGTKYLEIGAGSGIMSLSLKKLLDIDVTWAIIPGEAQTWTEWRRPSAKLHEKYNIHLKEGWIELDSADTFGHSYDIIVMSNVMEHLIYNPVNTFKKLRALLQDDGAIFISVPEDIHRYNVDSYKEMPYPEQLTEEERQRRETINDHYHFLEYSYAEAMEVFSESGLECVRYERSGVFHHFMLRKKQKP